MDIRIQELAHNLVSYSCRVGKGDQVYICLLYTSTAFAFRILMGR